MDHRVKPGGDEEEETLSRGGMKSTSLFDIVEKKPGRPLSPRGAR
jgi:hypothetical protein